MLFVSISFAFGSKRKRVFQWNMDLGFRLIGVQGPFAKTLSKSLSDLMIYIEGCCKILFTNLLSDAVSSISTHVKVH